MINATAMELLDDTPPTWSGPHVGLRLTEAMRTLAMMPMGLASGYRCWPAYVYEWEDLLAQEAQGELERTMKQQNKIRMLPSIREIGRMERCIVWPVDFLAKRFELLVATNAVAWARGIERDASWVARKRGGVSDTWAMRFDQGCDIIARGLRACRVPVF
jgi:hypothetical protein